MAKSLLIDFDGTVVKHEFPRIGAPMHDAFRVMKRLKEAGYRLILWTCREDEDERHRYLTEAVDFCRKNGIEFDAVNEGHEADEFRPPGKRRKPHVHAVIDDRNLGGFPGWDVVEQVLLEGKGATWITEDDCVDGEELLDN